MIVAIIIFLVVACAALFFIRKKKTEAANIAYCKMLKEAAGRSCIMPTGIKKICNQQPVTHIFNGMRICASCAKKIESEKDCLEPMKIPTRQL